jgi:hypothetical protein
MLPNRNPQPTPARNPNRRTTLTHQALLLRGREVGLLLESALSHLHGLKGAAHPCACPADEAYTAELGAAGSFLTAGASSRPAASPSKLRETSASAADAVPLTEMWAHGGSLAHPPQTPQTPQRPPAAGGHAHGHNNQQQQQQNGGAGAAAAALDEMGGPDGAADGGGPRLPDYGYGGLDDAWWARPANSVDPVTDLPEFLRAGPVDVK